MRAGRVASLILFVVLGALIGFTLPGYRASGVARYLGNFHPPYDPPEGRTTGRRSGGPPSRCRILDAGR